jgi:hypothetical protein
MIFWSLTWWLTNSVQCLRFHSDSRCTVSEKQRNPQPNLHFIVSRRVAERDALFVFQIRIQPYQQVCQPFYNADRYPAIQKVDYDLFIPRNLHGTALRGQRIRRSRLDTFCSSYWRALWHFQNTGLLFIGYSTINWGCRDSLIFINHRSYVGF